MLILKGNSMKSDVVNRIMQTSNSICFEYSDKPVCENSYYVDSTKHSLSILLEEIDGVLMHDSHDDYSLCDKSFDYIIVYTNVKESDMELYYFIDRLQIRKTGNWFKCKCREILVTCV